MKGGKNIKNQQDFVPMLDDLIFKFLFGYERNIEYTEYLLEMLFNYQPGELHGKIAILNSVNLEKVNYNDHGFELDINIKMKDNKIVNLEAYSKFSKIEKTKSLMYLAYLFSTQLNMGNKYSLANVHKQINIVKNTNVETRDYVILSKDPSHEQFLEDMFEIKVINIENFSKKNYNNNEKLTRLMNFLNAKSYEEIEKIIKGDKILEKMYNDAKNFINGQTREEYFSAKRYYDSRYEYEKEEAQRIGHELGLNEGHEQGLEQGLEQGIEMIAKNMLKEKIDINTIKKVTKLSKKQIEKLREE